MTILSSKTHCCKQRFLLPLSLLLFGVARGQTNQVSHGTVNVLLANSNGIAVATDSALSNGIVRIGLGQKLFKVDANSICTIAGWYWNKGPESANSGYPLSGSIPAFFSAFITQNEARLEHLAPPEKLGLIAQVFASALETVEQAALLAKQPAGSDTLELSLATVAEGTYALYQVNLIRSVERARVTYSVTSARDLVAKSKLIYLTAGITDVADPALQGYGPDVLLPSPEESYAQQIFYNGGEFLSIEDMEEICRQLVNATAQKHPIEVGSPIQLAIIQKSGGVIVDQPLLATNQPYALPGRISGIDFQNSSGQKIHAMAGARLFSYDQRLTKFIQDLDHNYFFGDTFTDCDLEYAGSPDVIFDRSNKVLNSRLILHRSNDKESPFVKKFQLDFPLVPVVVEE